MKLIIFSICKDEGETIGELLDRMPKNIKGVDEIETLVISDGSKDDTIQVAKKHGATHVVDGRIQKRLAYRFEQALDIVLKNGADIAANIDGDLQFRPEDIPKLVAPIIRGQAEFTAADRFTDNKTGQRFCPKNMPVGKYYANRVGAFITGSLSGRSFRDVTCGFRAYSREAMLALNINSNYTYTQESFQLLAFKNFTIQSIPVKVSYYPGRKSRVVTSFFQFLANSALNIMRAFRDFAPLKFFFWLGFGPFFIGASMAGFVALHYLETSRTSPYTSIGILGAYLFTMGLGIWGLGLVADMLGRNNRNQEKIIEKLKEIRYYK